MARRLSPSNAELGLLYYSYTPYPSFTQRLTITPYDEDYPYYCRNSPYSFLKGSFLRGANDAKVKCDQVRIGFSCSGDTNHRWIEPVERQCRRARRSHDGGNSRGNIHRGRNGPMRTD